MPDKTILVWFRNDLRIHDNEILVETAAPIQVSADDFGLVPGLNKLQELANAKAITPVSQVTFSIILKRG